MVIRYAGFSCEMNTIMEIIDRHHLFVIEDATQGMLAYYKGKSFSCIGDLGTLSFHETKSYTMGKGGTLLVCNQNLNDETDNLNDSCTDRQGFIQRLYIPEPCELNAHLFLIKANDEA